MNIRGFVSLSSVLLVGWLGATFVYEVPSKRYPRLDQAAAVATGEDGGGGELVPLVELESIVEAIPGEGGQRSR